MAADIAWNLESIPENAREQALRSARREGIPIGEWMTRQIYEGLADTHLRRREEGSAFSGRSEDREHLGGGSGDAVRKLQQDLGRLGKEINNSVYQSGTHVSALADRLDELSQDLSRLRNEASKASATVEEQLTQAAGQLTIQLSAISSRLESLVADSRNEQTRVCEAAKAVEQRLTSAEQTVQVLAAHRDDTARTVAAALEALVRQFDSVKDQTATAVEKMERRLGVVEHGLDWLGTVHKNEVHELTAQLGNLDGRFDAWSHATLEKADRLDSQVTGLQAQVNGWADRQQTGWQAHSNALDEISSKHDQAVSDMAVKLAELNREFAGKLEFGMKVLTQQQEAALAPLAARHDALQSAINNRLDAFGSGLDLLKQSAAASEQGHKDRTRYLDDTIAEIRLRQLEDSGALAHEIAGLSGRIDGLHHFSAHISETTKQRLDEVQQLTRELERGTTDRNQSLARDVQSFAEKLVSDLEALKQKATNIEQAQNEGLKTLYNTVAELKRHQSQAQSDSGRSTSEQTAALAARLDELQQSARQAREASDLRHEERLAEIRGQLIKLSRRTDDATADSAAKLAEVSTKLEQVLPNAHADATASTLALREELAEIRRLLAAKPESSEAPLAQLQQAIEQSNRRHEAQERQLDEKLQELSRKLAETNQGFERRLAIAQEELDGWQDSYKALIASLLANKAEPQSQAKKLDETAEQNHAVVAADQYSVADALFSRAVPPPLPPEFDALELIGNDAPRTAAGNATAPVQESELQPVVDAPVASDAVEKAGDPLETLTPDVLDNALASQASEPEPVVHAPVTSDAVEKSGDSLETLTPDVLDNAPAPSPASQPEPVVHAPVASDAAQWSGDDLETLTLDSIEPADALTTIIPPEGIASRLPPFPTLPPFPEPDARIAEFAGQSTPDPMTETLPQQTEQPTGEHGTSGSEAALRGSNPPASGFIFQARKAAQIAAMNRETPVGNIPAKTRLIVIAAFVVVAGLAAGARLWLNRISTPLPNSVAKVSAHSVKHPHAVAIASRPAAAPGRMRAPDTLLSRAGAGDVQAQLVLGMRALQSAQNPQSDKEAFLWLSSAAKQGDPTAECYLAMLYQKGRGVTADPRQAFNLYEAAASKGNRLAMNNLAMAYAQGLGVAKDMRQAALWFSEASDLGLVEAQFDLAVLYERGLGVPQSLADAYRWYTIAAHEGDTESKARAEAIASELSPAERDAADHDATLFKPVAMNAHANVPAHDTE
jgi:localization factor PodJL